MKTIFFILTVIAFAKTDGTYLIILEHLLLILLTFIICFNIQQTEFIKLYTIGTHNYVGTRMDM